MSVVYVWFVVREGVWAGVGARFRWPARRMTTTWAARTALRSCVRRHQGRDCRGDLSARSIARLTEDVLVGRPAGPDDHHGKHGRAPLLPCCITLVAPCWSPSEFLLFPCLRSIFPQLSEATPSWPLLIRIGIHACDLKHAYFILFPSLTY